VEVEWQWQRLGRFRGLVDGLVVAQVALVSDRDGVDPGWIVYLTGGSQALGGRHPTEFDAMAAAEARLRHVVHCRETVRLGFTSRRRPAT
jgi:hypothetical protein